MAIEVDELVELVTFARVVAERSFTAAALAMRVSKSVVSARVSSLEERLGTKLLHRTTRRLALTSEGARLHERCVLLLQAADEARAAMERVPPLPRGVLRISAPADFSDTILGAVIAEFVKTVPDVRVELVATNSIVDLGAEGFDIGIRIGPRLAEPSLVARKLATVTKLVCASPDYLRREGTPCHPSDLVHHRCLRFLSIPVHAEWSFETEGGLVAMTSPGVIAADTTFVLREAALAGHGLAAFPLYFVHEELKSGKLVRVLADHRLSDLHIFAVRPGGGPAPAKTRAFSDFLGKWLSRATWALRVTGEGARPRPSVADKASKG